MAYYRQSKRRTAEFLSTLLGQPCCAALTVKMQTVATEATRTGYQELVAQLPTQDHVNADATATKEQNGKAWLWTFVARAFTVFTIRPTREATAVDDFLTDAFRGVITCDRAKMYWRAERLQWCWAHLTASTFHAQNPQHRKYTSLPTQVGCLQFPICSFQFRSASFGLQQCFPLGAPRLAAGWACGIIVAVNFFPAQTNESWQ